MPNPLKLQCDSLPLMKIIQELYNQLQKNYKKNHLLNKLHVVRGLLIGYPWELFIDF